MPSTEQDGATGTRYRIEFYIGPCSEEDSYALAEAILALSEYRDAGGGGLGFVEVEDDE